MRLPIVLAAALACAMPARSQPPVPADPEAVLIDSLIVQATYDGPAWWNVYDEDSSVWILGTPSSPMPSDVEWNRSQVESAVAGARKVLASPGASARISAGTGALFRMTPGFRRFGGDPRSELPDDLAQRFEEVRRRIGQPASRYFSPIPFMAAVNLHNDRAAADGLRKFVETEVTEMAEARGIPVERPANYQSNDLEASEIDFDSPRMIACFAQVIDEAETPVDRFRQAGEAWGRGDLAGALAMPRDGFGFCGNMIINAGFSTYAIDTQTRAIEQALTQPGEVLALVPLRQLLAEDGVIAKLRARGHNILTPDEDETAERLSD